MEKLTKVLMYLMTVILVLCAFMLIRNEWVYSERMKLIGTTSEKCKILYTANPSAFDSTKCWDDEYRKKYLSYNEMMFRIHIWDIEKLKK